jgi:stage V sporulation protein D (sporulation-specific penicillin-binding protein)
MNPTLDAVAQCFGLDKTELETKITENPENQNIVILEGLTYSETEQFRAVKENTEENPNIRGVFLREEYVRKYEFSTLASDVIGFTSDNTGAVGLEAYYNEYLTGSEGKRVWVCKR